MRRRAVINLCLLAGAIGAMWLPTSAQGPGRRAVERVDGREARAREALVRFRSAPRDTDLDAVTNEVDAEAIARVGRTGIYRVRSRNLNAAALIERLSRRGDVEYAEPNYIVTIVGTPNDPSFSQLWGLENTGQPVAGTPGIAGADIHATAAWDVSIGSPNTVVAVIDTGIDYTHPDLGGEHVDRACAVHRRRSAAHRSPVPRARTASMRSPAPATRWTTTTTARTCRDDRRRRQQQRRRRRRELDDADDGHQVPRCQRQRHDRRCDQRHSSSRSQAKQAFAASGGADIRVLSNSWGGAQTFRRRCSTRSTRRTTRDMLFVAAAGNSGFNNDFLPDYPASYDAPNIVAVAATTNIDQRAWFSNYGATSVHLGAPGDDILSTTIGNSYAASQRHVDGDAARVGRGGARAVAVQRSTRPR